MNLNQLYYFKELAKERQFSKAAKNLYISQPSLSNSIKSLEQELHCQLINRNGGQITLTEYGEIFFKAAITSINSIEKSKIDIANYKRKEENIIKIASIPTAMSYYLPHIISEYKQKSPIQPKFYCYSDYSNNIYQNLEEGKVDIGICSKKSDYPNLIFLPLYNEEIIVITKKDHPLAQHTQISLTDLLPYDLITYFSQTSIGKKITSTLLASNSNLSIAGRGNDEFSLATQVLANDSVGIVVNNHFLDSFDIARIKINLPKNTRTVFLAYNPKVKMSQSIQLLINLMNKNKA